MIWDNEREIFETLNQKLKEANAEMTVICVGGFVLSQYGMRTNQDIDGFFKSTKKIRTIIKEVGDQYGINKPDELWLNNAVQNMNEAPPTDICEILYAFSNLKILMPPLAYIAGMKFTSMRERDIDDVASILKVQNITSPDVFRTTLADYGFEGIDEALLLEAFGRAYGMAWLEEYYFAHEEEINRRILGR